MTLHDREPGQKRPRSTAFAFKARMNTLEVRSRRNAYLGLALLVGRRELSNTTFHADADVALYGDGPYWRPFGVMLVSASVRARVPVPCEP